MGRVTKAGEGNSETLGQGAFDGSGSIGTTSSDEIGSTPKRVARVDKSRNPRTSSGAKVNASKNSPLNSAGIARQDQFFTRYEDVEAEMINYSVQLVGRSVLCNCDDSLNSAFFRYFVDNLNSLNLKKVVSTSYSGKDSYEGAFAEKPKPAWKAVVTRVPENFDSQNATSKDWETLFSQNGNSLSKLNGNGDFRSSESRELLDSADFVATNPPFSLFREYFRQLVEYKKDFVVLGNLAAATYKDIFPLFRDHKVFFGPSISSGDRKFWVPDNYPLIASGCGVDPDGQKFIRVKGVRWFTNLDSSQKKPFLNLTAKYDRDLYPAYENYDAIDVGRTSEIPTDFKGIMGVPITFIDKYNPQQFELIMLANGNARKSVSPETLHLVGYSEHPHDRGGVGILAGKRVFVRILLRKRDETG